MECRFLKHGRCAVAERLAEGNVVRVRPEHCEACAKTGTPETGEPNYMVASLAILTARHTPQERSFFDRLRKYLRKSPAVDKTSTKSLLEALPCVHRGESPIDERDCQLCGGEGKVEPVFTCAAHGVCTLRKYRNGRQDEAVCLICPERQAR